MSWHLPSDEQLASATATLAALIGAEEAARLHWQRRIVVRDADAKPCLLLYTCPQDEHAPNWCQRFEQVCDIPLAVSTLTGPADQNPEAILAARIEARDAAQKRLEAELERQRQAEARHAAELVERERMRKEFRWDDFARLPPWQQALFALAAEIEGAYPELSWAMRKIASFPAAREGEPCPVCPPAKKWWND